MTLSHRPEGFAADERESLAADVERAREGDEAAFARLFAGHYAALRNYLHRMVGDRDTAEDLAQESFVKAWCALPGTRPELVFKPWLYRIATNTAISHQRYRKSRPSEPLTPEHDRASAWSPAAAVDRLDVERTLARLPRHYATALRLHHVHGLTEPQTAAVLGVTKNTAKLRLFRARKAFARAYAAA